MTWDITQQLSLTGGLRYFKADNTLEGFYGYSGLNPFSSAQQLRHVPKCFAPGTSPWARRVHGTWSNRDTGRWPRVPRVNLTYKITPDAMVYATYSKGFRPGGVNRTAQVGIGPYQSDFLTNYEIGWKTQWFDHHLRWNGAIFKEDWKNFQFSFLGLNSVTIIENGGDAEIKGIESELEWAATSKLTMSLNFSWLDPKLTSNYCGTEDPATGQPARSNPCPANPAVGITEPFPPAAPSGTQLPITPKFKGNLIARYSFDPIGGWNPNAQAAFVYQTEATPALKTADVQYIGVMPAYGMADLSTGIEKNGMNIQFVIDNVTDKRGQTSRFEQCTVSVCQQPYIIPEQPRTYGIKFGQKF